MSVALSTSPVVSKLFAPGIITIVFSPPGVTQIGATPDDVPSATLTNFVST